MKYGLLIDFGWRRCNYGDYVQSIALEYLYSLIGIPKEEIIYLSYEQLRTYDGEQVLLPYSYVLTYIMDKKSGRMALSNKITPLFLSTSIGVGFTRPLDIFTTPSYGWIDLFRKVAPIGCRDEATRKFFDSIGVPAYLQSCISNILPRRQAGKYKKVLLIDCPLEILTYIPQELAKKAEVWENSADIGNLSMEENYDKIKQRYEYYCKNANLIVTTRYHVATPCTAMGIPSILLMRPFSGKAKDIRLDSLNPEISLYASDDYQNINWYPQPPYSNDLRSTITNLAIARIRETATLYVGAARIQNSLRERISDYENIHPDDHLLLEHLRNFVEENFASYTDGHFYIWAASNLLCDGDTVPLARIVKSVNPRLEFAGWLDTYKEGTLANKPIRKLTEVCLGKHDFIIVATDTIIPYALETFQALDISKKHFFIFFPQMLTQEDLKRVQTSNCSNRK